jgi:hypothetical protein
MADRRGLIRSLFIEPDLVLTRMQGRVDLGVIGVAYPEFSSALRRCASPRWLVDVCDLTGFDPDAVSGGAQWFADFRDAVQRSSGTKSPRIFFITDNAASRMAAYTLGFSVGMRVTVFATRAEAYGHFGIDPRIAAWPRLGSIEAFSLDAVDRRAPVEPDVSR